MSRARAILLPAFVGLSVLAWDLWQTRRLAEQAGAAEVAARAATADGERERKRADRAVADVGRLETQVSRLERDLDTALDYAHQLGEAMASEEQQRQQRAVQLASADALASLPVPPGVQSCLSALRDCLRADGFPSLRPLRASAVVDRVLADVELLDVEAGMTGGDLLVAARMTATLDRGRSELTLAFFDGARRAHGVRTELPKEGLCIRLQPVTGRMWEARLPMLIHAEGEYQVAESPPARGVDLLDPVSRTQWLERFDQLLADAGTELDLHVAGFADLRDATFRAAQLFGYDRGRLLALAADCSELAVEVDDRAGIVSLLLKDGSLRRDGAQSTIHREGYRMLLPNITPQQAIERMLGMVVHR